MSDRGAPESRLRALCAGVGVLAVLACSAAPEQEPSAGDEAGAAASVSPTSAGAGASLGGVPNSASMGGAAAIAHAGAAQGGSSGAAGAAAHAGAAGAASSNCKRGIGVAGPSLTNAELVPGIAWWYNWGASREGLVAGLEFVPMIWGAAALQNATAQLPAGARYLLGFNEPNFFGQSNLSAQAAAELWPQVEAIAKAKGLDLVSPAVNYCGDDESKTGPCHDTNPVSYLEDFFTACANCRVDYIAVHWYNCTASELQFYLGQFRRFNKLIWLTEFACAYGGDTSVAGQEAYMRAAVPILEADGHVQRYAWFSGDPMPSAKLLENGSLTPLGKVYAALPRGAGCQK